MYFMISQHLHEAFQYSATDFHFCSFFCQGGSESPISLFEENDHRRYNKLLNSWDNIFDLIWYEDKLFFNQHSEYRTRAERGYIRVGFNPSGSNNRKASSITKSTWFHKICGEFIYLSLQGHIYFYLYVKAISWISENPPAPVMNTLLCTNIVVLVI